MFKKVSRSQANRQKKRQKKCIPWIVHIFNHQCFVTYITGLYSCQWKTTQKIKPRFGPCCCSWREQLFYPFLVISSCLSVVLLFVWIETSNEYFSFDWVVFLGTGFWFFWSLLLLSLFGILAAYSSLLLILGFLLIWEGNELHLHWCHKILTLLVIGVCTFFMSILSIYWKDRWLTFGLSLKIFAPYLHLSSIIVMVILSWPVAFYLIHLEHEARMRRHKMTWYERRVKKFSILTKLRAIQVAVGLPFFIIILYLYLVPLGTYSPCIQEKDKLGPKPDFFGHRGAPMLGPENTMMSFEKAIENGVVGLESDVYLSYDEVPFLMHDNDLRRTTNIKEVMPNASLAPASFFTWDFLSTLNAGKWFVQSQSKPFYNMKPLSEADREKARQQMIPKLSDLLELAQKEKKFVIFDLNAPPPKHPLRNTFVRRVVRVILESKIEQHLIYWLTAFDRHFVKLKAPGFQQVGRLYSIEHLTKENITKINVDYKTLFYTGLRDYKAANININLYLVNEPWLYSLAWCSRINSVTTDNIQLLRQIKHPYFFMTPRYYMFMWFLMDGVSAVFIVAIFYFHWWRENKKEKALESTSSHTGKEASNLPIEHPSRSLERPWTLKPLYPALPNRIRKHPGPRQFLVAPEETDRNPEPVKETTKPEMPAKGNVRQLIPSEDFEPIQTPTWEATREATLQTVLLASKANEPTISSLEVPHPETQHRRMPTAESSQQSSLTMVSSTSYISLPSFTLSSEKK
ncbi:glycerophosphodiester phosphodiesterase domain-containing protein 4 [Rhinolophus ferrumequinum]|uniref:glycerophosphodiester phosphodiesterase domain-containing protein 4 n=1 Tax=Rhinolophus ferrumequinum TaxID=59479 RepID=UPI00140F88A1|nr:glycerophosphodiester phosphodiesterase domain-containing protein 4 [Rhinolophus ferrumequinum]